MQNGHGREGGGCMDLGFSEGNCLAQLTGGADVWQERLSWISLKVLLYDDLVHIVTSHHVTKMSVTTIDSIHHCQKPFAICKLHGSIFYRKNWNLLPIFYIV